LEAANPRTLTALPIGKAPPVPPEPPASLASLPLAILGPLSPGQTIDQSMLANVASPPPLVNRTQQALARDTVSTAREVLEQTFYPDTGMVSSRTNRRPARPTN